MTGFKIITEHGQEIKFEFYLDEAPLTSKEFYRILSFTRTFYQEYQDKKFGLIMFLNLISFKKTHQFLQYQAKLYLDRLNLSGQKQQIVLGYITEKEKV